MMGKHTDEYHITLSINVVRMASGIQSASDTLNCTVAFVFSLLTFIPPGPLFREYVIVSFSVRISNVISYLGLF